jgi:hypothetical protein
MVAGAACAAAGLVCRPEDIPHANELEAAMGLLRDLETETASFLGIAGASASTTEPGRPAQPLTVL